MEAVTNCAALVATSWLVLIAAHLVRYSPSPILLLSSIPLAAEIALQQRWIYVPVDRFIGGANYLSLLQQALCLVAIGLLSWMITTVTVFDGFRRRRIRIILGGIVAAGIGTELTTFGWGEWTTSDPFLLAELPAMNAVIYTSVNWLAMCAIAIVGGLAAWGDRSRHHDLTLNRGLVLVLLGSGLAAVASFLHFAVIYTSFHGNDTADTDRVLVVTIGVSATLIAFGLALPATPGIVSNQLLAARAYLSLRRLFRRNEIVNRAEDWGRLAQLVFSLDSLWLLHTQWVMYEDLTIIDRAVQLTPKQRAMMVSIKERTESSEPRRIEQVA